MHREAYQFVATQAARLPVSDAAVLEVGSYNVNGSVRPLFAGAASYVGLDSRAGPGVDVVSDIRNYHGGPFDIVVCCETLEHDADPGAMIEVMRYRLAPGGLLILTCAASERAPHGVMGGAVGNEAYTRITPAAMKRWLHGMDILTLEHHKDRGDLYVVAKRAPDE